MKLSIVLYHLKKNILAYILLIICIYLIFIIYSKIILDNFASITTPIKTAEITKPIETIPLKNENMLSKNIPPPKNKLTATTTPIIKNTTATNNSIIIPGSTGPLTANMTPMPTQISIPTTMSCIADNTVMGFCLNYNGCCAGNNIGVNTDCFCNHPTVLKCKADFDTCTGDDCKTQLKQCCMEYNNISIDNANFQKPIKHDQTTNKLCTINSIPNLEQKCMELCQTTPECKAYNINAFTCTLYNDIGLNSSKSAINDYYIKKPKP